MTVKGALWDDPRAAVPAEDRERVTRPDISEPGTTVEPAVVATSSDLAGVTEEGAAGVELDVRCVTWCWRPVRACFAAASFSAHQHPGDLDAV